MLATTSAPSQGQVARDGGTFATTSTWCAPELRPDTELPHLDSNQEPFD